ncbi:MAG: hypothetical protein ACYC69_17370 [Thermodesulfovibrionales bacterium]
MNNYELDSKQELIRAFFDEFSSKICKVQQLGEQAFIEEALILALCYISALAGYRYGRSSERDKFVKILFEYSDNKNAFKKISWFDFYKNGKDTSEKSKSGKAIANYHEIKATLVNKFAKASDHRQEMIKEDIIIYLQNENNTLNYRSIEACLDKFSYAAVLYEHYRCAGVHEGSMAVIWDAMSGMPLFEKNEYGDDIYYSGNILCFSRQIIMSSLESICRNLRKACLDAGKWPHALQS